MKNTFALITGLIVFLFFVQSSQAADRLLPCKKSFRDKIFHSVNPRPADQAVEHRFSWTPPSASCASDEPGSSG